jgi:hypothetical protein
MRLPSILDLLSAVRRVAPKHPAAQSWWLTPRARLPVKGETSLAERSVRVIELGIEGVASEDCSRIERELSELLPGTMINVRVLSPTERQGMIRLLTAEATQNAEASRERDAAVPQHAMRVEA